MTNRNLQNLNREEKTKSAEERLNVIKDALRASGGNIMQAARALEITPSHIHYYLRQYPEIERDLKSEGVTLRHKIGRPKIVENTTLKDESIYGFVKEAITKALK